MMKLENLRVAQLVELTEAQNSLARIEDKIANIYRASEQNSHKSELCKMYGEVRRLKALIEYLKIEILDKKYANFLGYSDVNPYEVVEECAENRYRIRAMIATEGDMTALKKSFVPGGFIGHFDNSLQNWVITPDENAVVFTIRRHKDGRWYDSNGNRYSIENAPRKFYDYNF